MSITITITIPGPTSLPGIPGPRPAPVGESTAPVVATRAEQVWHTVRPYVPVLLAGAESLVPGLGVVVALVGFVRVHTAPEQDRPEEEQRAAS